MHGWSPRSSDQLCPAPHGHPRSLSTAPSPPAPGAAARPAPRRSRRRSAGRAAGRGAGRAALSANHNRGLSHNDGGGASGAEAALIGRRQEGSHRRASPAPGRAERVRPAPPPHRHRPGKSGSRAGPCAGHSLPGWDFPCLVPPRLQGIASWGSGTDGIMVFGASHFFLLFILKYVDSKVSRETLLWSFSI